jgi:ribosomal protein S17E
LAPQIHHRPRRKISTDTSAPTLYHADHHLTTAIMGRVRTKTVKKSAKVIIERYYPKLTLDFETNKRICDEIAVIASKRLRNKVCSRRHG